VPETSKPLRLAVLALGLLLPSCAALSTLAPPPSLFPDRSEAERFDFERDSIGQPPEGFEAPQGHWAVVDSPTAASGNQVLVRGGQTASRLALKRSEPARAGSAEVTLRILLGSSGAGLACDGGDGGSSFVLEVEPHASRVALYGGKNGALTVVGQALSATPKGEWLRIGLRCDDAQVIGYVGGKPVLRSRSDLGAFDLALFSDAGVTAQFDDFEYWVGK
jgi:hypothetical protein